MTTTMIPTPPYADLDPGIRETVRWLHAHGFDTTDSGDGVSKFNDPANPYQGYDCALDWPHVFMACDPARLVAEADRLSALLEAHGIVLSGVIPTTPEEAEEWGVSWEPVPEGVVIGGIEASYTPGEGIAVIALNGLNDEKMGLRAAEEQSA